MIIAFADQEKEYLSMLYRQLLGSFQGITLACCFCIDDLNSLFAENSDDIILVIFNPADFPDLPNLMKSTWPGTRCDFRKFKADQTNSLENSQDKLHDSFFRFDPIKRQSDKLKVWIDMQKTAINVNAETDLKKSALHLIFSVEQTGYSPNRVKNRLREFIQTGHRVIYLPIMPTYQMAIIDQPGTGSSMSDLLMLILAQNIQADQISQYWKPHPEGFLQFNPPDRSDDLVLCHTDLLRSFISLLQTRINMDQEIYDVLIDCSGIPLVSVTSVAVLCDTCEIILPESTGFAAVSANLEASRLLAQLPSGCKIRN